jgi:hypothetical protein
MAKQNIRYSFCHFCFGKRIRINVESKNFGKRQRLKLIRFADFGCPVKCAKRIVIGITKNQDAITKQIPSSKLQYTNKNILTVERTRITFSFSKGKRFLIIMLNKNCIVTTAVSVTRKKELHILSGR